MKTNGRIYIQAKSSDLLEGLFDKLYGCLNKEEARLLGIKEHCDYENGGMEVNLPCTYEEYGKMNGFGTVEMEDELAPLAKKLYEKMAGIINKIEPFSEEEIISISNKEDLYYLEDVMMLSKEFGHMTEKYIQS